MSRPQVLLTLPDRPWPADGGKRMRVSAELRALAQLDIDLDVVVLFAGDPVSEPLPPGVTVREFRQVGPPPRRKPAAALAASARAVPWQVAVLRWGQARREMDFVRGRRYDLVWFGNTDHAVSLRRFVAADRTVVDMDDVEVPKQEAFLALPRGTGGLSGLTRLQRRIELPLWRRVQRKVIRQADTLIVCSELDRSRLGAAGNVSVVPNGYPRPARRLPPPADGPPTVVFVATYFYAPNVDAATFAATEVLPELRRRVPGARLRLVGRGGYEALGALAGLDGVDVVGAVPDPAAELARAHAVLAPIRYGGGTRIKILEAFAYGVPVVSTPLGCEGLDVEPGVHLVVGDDAAGLAGGCARVLGDPGLGARIADAGHELYLARFQDTVGQQAVQAVAAEVLGRTPTRPARPR